MMQFYHAGIKNILTLGITEWYGNASVQERKRLNKMVQTASKIISQD